MCPHTLTCASTYQECTTEVYCPYGAQNYTLSPDSYLCGDGPQLCVLDRQMCQSTACSADFAFWAPDDSQMLPYENFDPLALHTCIDGRCMMNGVCMTAFQCSSNYIKAGGFGIFCVSDTEFADAALQTSIQLHSQTCPPGSITCLGGQCRATIYDCP